MALCYGHGPQEHDRPRHFALGLRHGCRRIRTVGRWAPTPSGPATLGNVGLTRRRDFIAGLFLAAAPGPAPAKQHRIAIIIPAGAVVSISMTTRFWRTFFEELRRLGDVEGQNLTVERYSGDGRPEGYADLTRKIVGHNPDVIVAITNPVASAARSHRHNTDRLDRD